MTNQNIENHFEKFNNLIDGLITGFQKNNLDEDSITFLVKNTRQFRTFTQTVLLKILFKALEKGGSLKYHFNDEIEYVNKMQEDIFKYLDDSLEAIVHDYGNEDTQKHVDEIIIYLSFVKQIITNLCEMVLSVLKFQNDNIDEEEFRKGYRKFKSKLDLELVEFKETIKKEEK